MRQRIEKNPLFPAYWFYASGLRRTSAWHTLSSNPGGGGGGHSLIWPIRGRAAGQGMVFGLLCPEQGIQFYANLS